MSPLRPIRLGVAARPTHRPISNGHSPSFSGSFCRLEFQGTDERRGTAELVESQQAQRVAHQHAQTRGLHARVSQPSVDQREGGQAEVGFGLAAAGREEQQVHDLAVLVE